MCLVALAIDQSRRFPLVVASNRDEFHARPTARLGWWVPPGGGPAILSGRDLQAGGTWFGLTAEGRMALVTNVRGMGANDPDAPSRGAIVPDWLSARDSTDKFWVRTVLTGYNGFNLIAADFRRGECFWASNHQVHPQRLERGVHGLSNALLDTPWPKVRQLKSRVGAAIEVADDTDALARALFEALADRSEAADEDLPDTGLGLDRERMLSPAFIRSADGLYGTRCSTLLIAERIGKQLVTTVLERSFSASGVALMRRTELKHWPPRYETDDAVAREVRAEPVADAELGESATTPPPRRTRVRSLLKPSAGRRRTPA